MLVIGGSGSGKSVLLKCIIGLLHPDAGSIKVDDEEVVGIYGAELDRVRRQFGMLLQNAALFDSLPVWENVALGLHQRQKERRVGNEWGSPFRHARGPLKSKKKTNK